MIALPPPDAVLYPRDRVLLMGTTEQVNAGKHFLGTVSGAKDSLQEEVLMESVRIPFRGPLAGRTLGELALARTRGVQIAGVDRRGLRILNPGAHEQLQAGEEVLVLGTQTQLRAFRVWLRENDLPAE